MADEKEIKITLPEGVEAPKEDEKQSEPADQTPEYTEVELEAMKHGWKPESEFTPKGNRKWKSAEKFMEDKPLYDKIDEQHKAIRKLEKASEMMRQHYEKVEQAAFNRALEALKAERKQALEEGDLVRAEEIRDEIDERKQNAPRPQPPQPDQELVDNLQGWKQRNDWYEKDEDMTAFADGLGNKLLKSGKTANEILEVVETKVRAAFPQKFRNPNRDSAPRVEGSSRKASGRSDDVSTFMSPMEIKLMEGFLRSGAPITREEYIRDVKKQKGVK